MKIIITSIALLLSVCTLAADRYEKNMSANVESLFAAETKEDLQGIANKFDRIANAEPEKWLPRYYSSLSYVWMANREQDPATRDKHLDLAQSQIEKAAEITTHSEITALQGFIYMIRIGVDPASRGASYSQKAMQEFAKAAEMDPENPRPQFFKGQMEFGTAQFFKMDTSSACQTMANSLELFDKFTPETAISPNWGHGYAKRTVENCND